MLDNFGWGIHAYSSNATAVQSLDIVENICFNAGSLHGPTRNILIGADSGIAQSIRLFGNKTYNAATGISFYGSGANLTEMSDNYCPDNKGGSYTAAVETGNYWGAAVGNQTYLFPNDYDLTRANLAIYNQAEANAIEVDVSAIYANGAQVQARNAQDYFNDIQALTVIDGKISVNMQVANRTVETPIQWTAPATTFPLFGCFVLSS